MPPPTPKPTQPPKHTNALTLSHAHKCFDRMLLVAMALARFCVVIRKRDTHILSTLCHHRHHTTLLCNQNRPLT